MRNAPISERERKDYVLNKAIALRCCRIEKVLKIRSIIIEKPLENVKKMRSDEEKMKIKIKEKIIVLYVLFATSFSRKNSIVETHKISI